MNEYNHLCSLVGIHFVKLYHRKRIEKERIEEKRKERQLEAMMKIVKTAGEGSRVNCQ